MKSCRQTASISAKDTEGGDDTGLTGANSFERAWRIQAGAVTETAMRLGCERGTFSRLLNGKAGVSANMALALEDIGWGTAGHWMRMQASYDLMQARRARVDSEKRDTALQQR